MLGSMLKDTLKEGIASCKEQAQGAITKAATTRLEWKMVNAMTNMSKEDGKQEIICSEREYSTKYRLTKETYVHNSILKKRADLD